jgi:hypothetical protein
MAVPHAYQVKKEAIVAKVQLCLEVAAPNLEISCDSDFQVANAPVLNQLLTSSCKKVINDRKCFFFIY